jgi:hypothetical protein
MELVIIPDHGSSDPPKTQPDQCVVGLGPKFFTHHKTGADYGLEIFLPRPDSKFIHKKLGLTRSNHMSGRLELRNLTGWLCRARFLAKEKIPDLF